MFIMFVSSFRLLSSTSQPMFAARLSRPLALRATSFLRFRPSVSAFPFSSSAAPSPAPVSKLSSPAPTPPSPAHGLANAGQQAASDGPVLRKLPLPGTDPK